MFTYHIAMQNHFKIAMIYCYFFPSSMYATDVCNLKYVTFKLTSSNINRWFQSNVGFRMILGSWVFCSNCSS